MNELFSRTKERSYENKLVPEHVTTGLSNKPFSKPPCEANPFFVYPLSIKKKIFFNNWTRFAFVEQRMPRSSLLEIHSMGVNEGTDQNLNSMPNLIMGTGRNNLRICLNCMCWT